MSVDAGPNASRTNTTDGPADPYDHAITLIDGTLPAETESGPRTRSSSPSWRNLVKKGTKSSLRDERARRKYAKWQQERYSSNDVRPENGEVSNASPPISRKPSSQILASTPLEPTEQTDTADFAGNPTPVDGAIKADKSRKQHAKHKEPPSDVDILYENQRGWFFFGIPLYSHSSLLNFDPGPWVNKDFKDSAVNITNAQVPDPSWDWSWKRWYVDMSYDVDEEGWQYSFHFAKTFAWHGTHPWWHSWVRRRRWLRKRVMTHDAASNANDDSMSAAHKLTADYFTIHSKRDRSPATLPGGGPTTARPDSYISMRSVPDADQPPEDISSIPNLLRALRLATIDREKIDLVKRFVREGGEELAYLAENVPEVMSFLVFQNSRRQLLIYFQDTAAELRRHRNEHEADARAEGEAESRRIDNLLAAEKVADKEIRGLEYWSDRKHVLKIADDSDGRSEELAKSEAPSAGVGSENDPVQGIKGIPEAAEVDIYHTRQGINADPWADNDATNNKRDKGKSKAEASDRAEDIEQPKSFNDDPTTQLPRDSVLIPDTEEKVH